MIIITYQVALSLNILKNNILKYFNVLIKDPTSSFVEVNKIDHKSKRNIGIFVLWGRVRIPDEWLARIFYTIHISWSREYVYWCFNRNERYTRIFPVSWLLWPGMQRKISLKNNLSIKLDFLKHLTRLNETIIYVLIKYIN